MTLRIDLDKDSITGGYQLSIQDENGGYRLVGPKYTGHSKTITSKVLDAHDAEMIRKYLDKHFPVCTCNKLPLPEPADDLCPVHGWDSGSDQLKKKEEPEEDYLYGAFYVGHNLFRGIVLACNKCIFLSDSSYNSRQEAISSANKWIEDNQLIGFARMF